MIAKQCTLFFRSRWISKGWFIGSVSKTFSDSDKNTKARLSQRSPLSRLVTLCVCICFLTTLLQTGCTKMQIPDYPILPFEKYEYTISTLDGLNIAVHPIFDEEESSEYFATDLLSSNVLAMFVQIENNNPISSFIIYRDRISLSNNVSASSAQELLDQIASLTPGHTVQSLGGASTLFLPPLAIFLLPIGGIMISNAAERRHNFAVMELHTQTLSPGERTHGFVYFPISVENRSSGKGYIRFEVYDLNSKETNIVELGFDWII